MSKRIIFKYKDTIAVVIPSASALKKDRTLTQIALKAMKELKLSAETKYEIIDASSIPSDRTFRDAWEQDGAKIKIDMPKARVIYMDKIRVVRNKELEKTDKIILRDEEQGKDVSALKTERQSLRDIPQNLDLESASTPEELTAIWPEGLTSSDY